MTFAANLLSPPILFFLLGLTAVFVRSNLELPDPVPKLLSLYLLMSLGFRGGVELSQGGFEPGALATLAASFAMACLVPLYAFTWLRRQTDRPNAAALAAAYGSVSAVTFVTASDFLGSAGLPHGGHMVAALALMESPAIVVGLLLARGGRTAGKTPAAGPASSAAIDPLLPHLRHALVDGTVVVLLGSLVIGLVTGTRGDEAIAPFTRGLFQGVLCLFLLDMGMVAGRRLAASGMPPGWLVVVAIVVPLANAAIGVAVSHALSLRTGDAFLFCVLCASASYIAVPAAMRQALPEADPGLYVTAPIALTFPFNILVGMPLYLAALRATGG